MRRFCFLALVLPVSVSLGCATNLSNLKTAETLNQHQVHASAEMGIFIPAGTIARAVSLAADQAEALSDAAQTGASAAPTPDEQRDIFATALNLAVFPPGVTTNLHLRYGIIENLDVGIRFPSSYRVDVRYRFLKIARKGSHNSFHLAGVLGWEKHRFSGLVFDLYEKIGDFAEFVKLAELEKPSRWDLEAALLVSWNFREIVRPYLGLSYRAGHYSLPVQLGIEYQDGSPPLLAEEDLKGWVHFVGMTSGLAVGYRWVYLLLELDLAYLFARPKILGEPTEFGGVMVFPAFSLALRIP